MPDGAQSKEKEAQGEALPSYEDISGPSTIRETPETGPTAASPFNFPPDSDLPPYSALAVNTSDRRPIAIPQIQADPTSPFLEASSPSLLRHGITQATWFGFIRTLSGFLAATVSQKAISHASDMAQHVGDVPKRFGKDTMAHIKASGKAIKDTAKSGNFIGAAFHVVGATIGIPVATALRAAGAAVVLPFAAINAVSREPKTPKERAVAYIAAANIKWLHRRGLDAHLLDTAELGQVLGLSVDELLQASRGAKDASAEGQLGALGSHIAELNIRVPGPLELGAGTFWLVVTERGEDPEDASGKGKGKGKEKKKI
ncbi:hypothetical protein F4813DRAFT_389523 [Daldinia decipiens]|uniref:uncharacterized protein n=1 Tax=Daldinia decipiens TaxID=326647 RepID=UPI0020C24893|nr:uncharacterized protein F4813DRAFT_389523 [Daldinia decipiens]KAI1657785.1 hypothetical protein F4813DRAFT_389523 [Daldinia decipiens]